MAGHQLNVRLSSDDDADLCSWAAELGLERSALGKEIFREALLARREGRASFERPATLGPGDLIAINAKLDGALMEIERIADTWAAHEAQMRKLERKDQVLLHRARTEFIAGMPERIGNSLNPIRKEMEELAGRIEKQPRLDAIDGGLPELRAELKSNTAQVAALEKQPRRITGIVLGDDRVWSTGFLCLWSIAMMLIGWTALVPVFSATSANTIIASGVLADDTAMCELIERRYGRSDCQVPVIRRIALAGPERGGSPRKRVRQ